MSYSFSLHPCFAKGVVSVSGSSGVPVYAALFQSFVASFVAFLSICTLGAQCTVFFRVLFLAHCGGLAMSFDTQTPLRVTACMK